MTFGGLGARLNPLTPQGNQRQSTTPQFGHDKSTYFVVIALLGFAMNSLPYYFFQEFYLVNPFHSGFLGSPVASWISFLIPLCFFTIFYFYGKRTILRFNESYLTVIPILFFGSVFGYAMFVASAPFFNGEPDLSGDFMLGEVSTSLGQVFVGFSALALAFVRVGGLRDTSIRTSNSLP